MVCRSVVKGNRKMVECVVYTATFFYSTFTHIVDFCTKLHYFSWTTDLQTTVHVINQSINLIHTRKEMYNKYVHVNSDRESMLACIKLCTVA